MDLPTILIPAQKLRMGEFQERLTHKSAHAVHDCSRNHGCTTVGAESLDLVKSLLDGLFV